MSAEMKAKYGDRWDGLVNYLASLVERYGPLVVEKLLELFLGLAKAEASSLVASLPVKHDCHTCCECLEKALCCQAQAIHNTLHALECCCEGDNCNH